MASSAHGVEAAFRGSRGRRLESERPFGSAAVSHRYRREEREYCGERKPGNIL